MRPFRQFPGQHNEDPPDDDAENFGLFMNFFSRATKDPKWLDTVKGSLSSGAAAISEVPKEMTGFLAKQLEKVETHNQTLTEQLDQMRDLLTPEQLISWRSARSAKAGGPASPSPKGGNAPPPENPLPVDPPKKKKAGWL